tara:strand:- start:13131 stop:15017 length:1887 start_codon:yes stop_codon:yes gene_type:complete
VAEQSAKLQVSELDYRSIKSNLIAFLKSQSEFSNFDFAGSGLDVIMDLLSYNTYYNSFYLNMLANEMFLDTAELRNSVVQKAKQIGYTPRSVQGTKAIVSLDIVPSDEATTMIVEKDKRFSSTINEQKYIFTTADSYAGILDATGKFTINDVQLNQGVRITHKYKVDYNNKEQQFILPNTNTDITTLSVVVKASSSSTETHAYQLISDTVKVTPTSNVYFLYESFENKFEVQFGDNKVGYRPADGSQIILAANISDGAATNKAATFRAVDPIGGYSNVSISTTTVGYGGAGRESIAEIKYNAPKLYETQNRCVTLNDYKRIVEKEWVNAESVTCWGGEQNDPPRYGKAYIAVKPKSGLFLTTKDKEVIKKEILATKNMVSVTPEIVAPDYLYIAIAANVRFDPNKTVQSPQEIGERIVSTCIDYNTQELGKFDLRFRYSRLTTLIDNSDPAVLNNQTTVLLFKRLAVELGQAFNYSQNFSNQIKFPYKGYKGALKSSKFEYINENTNVLEQNTLLNDADGIIQVVKEEAGAVAIVNSNVGTIDYETGKMTLVGFIPNSVEKVVNNNTIEIYVETNVQDVTPIREQVIIINKKDVTVNMIVDTALSTGDFAQATVNETPALVVYGANTA